MSDEATKKATAATSEIMDEVFREAMRSYEKALKSGIQLQEESVNLWKELFTKLGSPKELQAKLESMTAAAFPKARRQMEEFIETFNRTSNQTIDLFEKTLAVYQATSVPDAQRRVQDLIESSLTTLRVNVHSALNTNAKIIASWKELWTFQPGREVIACTKKNTLGDKAMPKEIHVASSVRTPLGSISGVFADVSAKSHFER
jgi:hypothetical protein